MKIAQLILCWPLLAALVAGCAPETSPESRASSPPVPVEEAPSFTCRAWQLLDSGTTASFRGLSAVSDTVVWVSGTGGTWGRTTDGGETWIMGAVPGAEELDFRDIDAFDDRTAYLMSAGPGEASRIYKTIDGGETWEPRYSNPSPAGFWDGMAFWDAERGALYGDPVDGRFVVLLTDDGGATWSLVSPEAMPPALEGEAGFAASGSGIAVAAGGHAWLGTGGAAARVLHSADYGRAWTVAETPMLAGDGGSSGIFSIAFSSALHGFVVGGDYTRPEAVAGNAARTKDGGLHWDRSGSPPAGYRSAVAYAPGTGGRVLLAVGTSGSDFSLDFGETWSPLGIEGSPPGGLTENASHEAQTSGFNVVGFGGSPCAAWAAGADGRLARLVEM